MGMGYESLHIMELLSVQCLQVDDVINEAEKCNPYIVCLQCIVVLVGVLLKEGWYSGKVG